ncbi:(d)CMP kinase [Ruminococcus sp.]|uniref:(d)CMP kinase n=1 Tax=Ruminococcus sp. TaxID=41978 RepID=UPI0025E13389|nr:(d)CMP kinase [Ruminococcus sp.]
MKTINIAIDGPAGAGKSSIAREVASELGFVYVDTGALYRAIALFSTEYSSRREFLNALEDDCHLEMKYFGGTQCIFLNGDNITDKIRTPEISMKASEVSALPEVREFLLETQKDIAREYNVIMDGRDIGTVVLPDADLKIYLTASAEERASRRYLELEDKPDAPSYEQLLEEIKQRDYNDMHREVAPLKQAKDAVLIDSTTMGFHEVCEEILDLIEERLDLE